MDDQNRTTGEWAALVKPIADRFHLGATMGLEVTHNPVGAAAVAGLLHEMARKLDDAVAMGLAERPANGR